MHSRRDLPSATNGRDLNLCIHLARLPLPHDQAPIEDANNPLSKYQQLPPSSVPFPSTFLGPNRFKLTNLFASLENPHADECIVKSGIYDVLVGDDSTNGAGSGRRRNKKEIEASHVVSLQSIREGGGDLKSFA